MSECGCKITAVKIGEKVMYDFDADDPEPVCRSESYPVHAMVIDRSACETHSDAALAAKDERIRELEASISAAWSGLANSFEIEPRSYFEEKYKDQALEIAIHYIWKRDAKFAQLRQQVEAEVREDDAKEPQC